MISFGVLSDLGTESREVGLLATSAESSAKAGEPMKSRGRSDCESWKEELSQSRRVGVHCSAGLPSLL